MQLPLQITFKGFPHSDAVETNIRERVEKLDRFFSHVISCRVVVEAEHHHHHQGNLYHVSIHIKVPRKELVVSREHHDRQSHEDVYVAIRDAFNAAKRQLEDFSRTIRGDVKIHDAYDIGTVVELYPDQDHGFISTGNGREVYFHKNSVLSGNFADLRIGSEVQFTEEEGENGPQASTVRA